MIVLIWLHLFYTTVQMIFFQNIQYLVYNNHITFWIENKKEEEKEDGKQKRGKEDDEEGKPNGYLELFHFILL